MAAAKEKKYSRAEAETAAPGNRKSAESPAGADIKRGPDETSSSSRSNTMTILAIDTIIEQQEVLGYNALIQIAAKMNIGEAWAPMRQSLQEEEDMVARTRTD